MVPERCKDHTGNLPGERFLVVLATTLLKILIRVLKILRNVYQPAIQQKDENFNIETLGEMKLKLKRYVCIAMLSALLLAAFAVQNGSGLISAAETPPAESSE